MICYLDTSALVKLYVHEQGSEIVHKLVDEAVVVATCKVAYPEARSALARGFREEMLTEKDYRLVVTVLQQDWSRYLALDVTDSLVWLAGDLAEQHRLRGFDAVHLAAALSLKAQVKSQVVAACWDVRLWDAMSAVGLEVLPVMLS
jgi:predicted nucleic acid-binding protein